MDAGARYKQLHQVAFTAKFCQLLMKASFIPKVSNVAGCVCNALLQGLTQLKCIIHHACVLSMLFQGP